MSSKALLHVTCKAIIMFGNRILLLKKIINSYDGFGIWELPGGGMEHKESPDQAIKREVYEETGIQLQDVQVKSTFYIERENLDIVGIIYLTHVNSNEVILSDEHSAYAWVLLCDLDLYLSPTIQNDILKSV